MSQNAKTLFMVGSLMLALTACKGGASGTSASTTPVDANTQTGGSNGSSQPVLHDLKMGAITKIIPLSDGDRLAVFENSKIAKLDAYNQLVTDFGTGGIVDLQPTEVSTGQDPVPPKVVIADALLDPTGKIAIAANLRNSNYYAFKFFVLNLDGSFDTEFGGGDGYYNFFLAKTSDYPDSNIVSLTLDSNGKYKMMATYKQRYYTFYIVPPGNAASGYESGDVFRFMIASGTDQDGNRYNIGYEMNAYNDGQTVKYWYNLHVRKMLPTGYYDPNFAGNGIFGDEAGEFFTPFQDSSSDGLKSLQAAVSADGHVYIYGEESGTDNKFVVAINSAGAVEQNFAQSGIHWLDGQLATRVQIQDAAANNNGLVLGGSYLKDDQVTKAGYVLSFDNLGVSQEKMLSDNSFVSMVQNKDSGFELGVGFYDSQGDVRTDSSQLLDY